MNRISRHLLWAIFGRSCRRRVVCRISWRKVPLRSTIYRTCSAGTVCLSISPARRTRNCRRKWCSFSSGRFSSTFCYGRNQNPTALCCKPCPSANFHILCPWANDTSIEGKKKKQNTFKSKRFCEQYSFHWSWTSR